MKKILIVDDEKMMRMITKKILGAHYEIVMAASGNEALEVYEKEKPDLVLLDLMMPDISGYEVFKILRERHGEKVLVIFLTADSDENSESKGLEIGAKDYIKKPLKPNVLLTRIEATLNSAREMADMSRKAGTDQMTGLLNRAATEQSINDALAGDVDAAFLMFDIDSFKLVNDLHSHELGDKILIAFADILRGELKADDIIGRMGGDEFIAFSRGLNRGQIKILSDNVNAKLIAAAKKLLGDDMNIPLGASIGCVFTDAGKNFDELYRKADKALCHVKNHGKHGSHIFGDAADDSPAEVSTLADIKKRYAERNILPGAYGVGSNGFQIIYRFLNRLALFKEANFYLMSVTVTVKKNDADLTDAVEDIWSATLKSLRKSDVAAKNGANQILILLPNIELQNVANVQNRLEKLFAYIAAKHHCVVKIEVE